MTVSQGPIQALTWHPPKEFEQVHHEAVPVRYPPDHPVAPRHEPHSRAILTSTPVIHDNPLSISASPASKRTQAKRNRG